MAASSLAASTHRGPADGVQVSFDELGAPLSDATFVVVDLETTGGKPDQGEITEIGAVKVRGGEVLGEFQSLVNPGVGIPPLIASLTGITDAAVAGAPGVGPTVASFLEFSAGAVLVAHNAPYDMGFLRGACKVHGIAWPRPAVLDTARISRAALLRDEVPNHRLRTLAAHVGSATTPNHRALADARATVDVLHYLIGRVGDLGITTVEDLRDLTTRVSKQQRKKRSMADGLPNVPGVYQFLDEAGRPLYIGTSKHVRDRVRSYFTSAEQRSRMAEMIGLAAQVSVIPCATALEAAVRESRLLAAHKPPYNRRSRFPEKQAWVKLTVEPFPRLSAVSRPLGDHQSGAAYLGPLPSRRTARAVVEALQMAFPVRSCTTRFPLQPDSPACLAADLGHCLAPCDGRVGRQEYLRMIDALRDSFGTGLQGVAETMLGRAQQQAEQGKYERAAEWRDALQRIADAIGATHRHAMLADCAELVAALPATGGAWEIHVIRHGRLAAAGVAQPSCDPREAVLRLRTGAEVVETSQGLPAASLTELAHIHRWLAEPGVRLVEAEPALRMPRSPAIELAQRLRHASGAERGHRSAPLPARSERQRITRIALGDAVSAARP